MQLPTHSHTKYDNDKMLSDMALEEGSGGYPDDNLDDEDYIEGSGDDGSGDGGEFLLLCFILCNILKTIELTVETPFKLSFSP